MARQFLLRKVIHVPDALLEVGMQPRNLFFLVLDKRLHCTHLLTQLFFAAGSPTWHALQQNGLA